MRTAMRKILLGFLALFLAGQVAIAQPVSDNAVIPMGITLSSVLRLNVVSGGNIEFVFNSIAQFQEGLYGDMYRTNLTVASSTDWSLDVYASNDFTGSAGTFGVGIVDFCPEDNGGANTVVDADPGLLGGVGTWFAGGGAVYTIPTTGDFIALTNGAVTVLSPNTDGNDGVAADNNFFLRWRCGVGAAPVIGPPGANATLINDWAGTGPGRSSTNVLVTLTAQ